MRPLEKVLDVLQEECAEVIQELSHIIQAISKVKRFGLYDEYQGVTNVARLTEEIGHVKCMFLELQVLVPGITDDLILKALHEKEKKLDYWLPHECTTGYIPKEKKQ